MALEESGYPEIVESLSLPVRRCLLWAELDAEMQLEKLQRDEKPLTPLLNGKYTDRRQGP